MITLLLHINNPQCRQCFFQRAYRSLQRRLAPILPLATVNIATVLTCDGV
jgi:hypothetical protein